MLQIGKNFKNFNGKYCPKICIIVKPFDNTKKMFVVLAKSKKVFFWPDAFTFKLN